jgi:hypothetical protein
MTSSVAEYGARVIGEDHELAGEAVMVLGAVDASV